MVINLTLRNRIPWLNYSFWGYGSAVINYGKTAWLTMVDHA